HPVARARDVDPGGLLVVVDADTALQKVHALPREVHAARELPRVVDRGGACVRAHHLEGDPRGIDAVGHRDDLVVGAVDGDRVERAEGGLGPGPGPGVAVGLPAGVATGVAALVIASVVTGLRRRIGGLLPGSGRHAAADGEAAGEGDDDRDDDADDQLEQPDADRDDPRLLLVLVVAGQAAPLLVPGRAHQVHDEVDEGPDA